MQPSAINVNLKVDLVLVTGLMDQIKRHIETAKSDVHFALMFQTPSMRVARKEQDKGVSEEQKEAFYAREKERDWKKIEQETKSAQEKFATLAAEMDKVLAKMDSDTREGLGKYVDDILSEAWMRDDRGSQRWSTLPPEAQATCKNLHERILALQGKEMTAELKGELEKFRGSCKDALVVPDIAALGEFKSRLLAQQAQIKQDLDSIAKEPLKYQSEKLRGFYNRLAGLERKFNDYHQTVLYKVLHFFHLTKGSDKQFDHIKDLKECVEQKVRKANEAIKGEKLVGDLWDGKYEKVTEKEKETALDEATKVVDEADEFLLKADPKHKL